jgi:hypothetical protein
MSPLLSAAGGSSVRRRVGDFPMSRRLSTRDNQRRRHTCHCCRTPCLRGRDLLVGDGGLACRLEAWLQSRTVTDKACMCRPARSPTNDAPNENVDDKGHVDETLPSGDIGGIRNPQPVWCRGFELAIRPVKRVRGHLVRERRADRLSPNDPLQAHRPHRPTDSAAGDIEAFTLQSPLGLANAIDAEILLEHPAYLDLQVDIAAGANRQTVHIQALGDVLVVG